MGDASDTTKQIILDERGLCAPNIKREGGGIFIAIRCFKQRPETVQILIDLGMCGQKISLCLSANVRVSPASFRGLH